MTTTPPPLRSRRHPRPRVSVRQLLATVAVMACVNAFGVSMDRPLASGPSEAIAEGQGYFATPESAREQSVVAEYRVNVLQLVTILVGNTFVVTALGFCVLANYLEEVRQHRSATGDPSSQQMNPERPSTSSPHPGGWGERNDPR